IGASGRASASFRAAGAGRSERIVRIVFHDRLPWCAKGKCRTRAGSLADYGRRSARFRTHPPCPGLAARTARRRGGDGAHRLSRGASGCYIAELSGPGAARAGAPPTSLLTMATVDLASGGAPLTVLSEDEQMFRDAVRQFAEDDVRPRVHAMDEAQRMDPDL